MPFSLIRQQLLGRGYWEETPSDDGQGSSTGGSEDNTSDEVEKPAEKPAEEQSKEKPSDSEAKLLKEVMKRKERERALEEELKNVKSKLNQFDGIDLNEVQSLLAAQKDQKLKELEAKGQWDALKEQMRTENEKIVALKEQTIETLSKDLKDKDALIQRLTIEHEFSSSKFIIEDTNLSPKKAKIIYGEYFEVEDGKVVPYNKPAGEPNRVPLVDERGDTLSFNAAIEKIIENDPDKNMIVKSKMKAGANSGTTGNTKVANKPVQLTGIAKIEAGLREGKK